MAEAIEMGDRIALAHASPLAAASTAILIALRAPVEVEEEDKFWNWGVLAPEIDPKSNAGDPEPTLAHALVPLVGKVPKEGRWVTELIPLSLV